MEQPLLQIHNLTTSFSIKESYYPAVDRLSLTIHSNEILAVVGESGCGKSALALSILGLHDPLRTKMEGSVAFQGTDLLQLTDRELNKIRGNKLAMIFQDPMTALHPLLRIGRQIEEPMSAHTNWTAKERKQRTLQLLAQVGITHTEQVYRQYPHQLSGGMRQRVLIAMALACDPVLLIADEPTTALDVTIQAQILDLLKELQQQSGAGILLITHDLGVVAETADRVAVMYAGEIVEIATVQELFRNPKHPYTRLLLLSVPSQAGRQEKLPVIEGIVPPIEQLKRNGCRFAQRIPSVAQSAHEDQPALREISPGHFVRCTCHRHFHVPGEKAYETAAAH